ncbi:hypothetical protein [Paludifilum halophilum]|uniref:hypothetical protein n=1 Tax=Paludifilum halophilum TaxID=1642702 RepID=UPI0026CEB9C0
MAIARSLVNHLDLLLADEPTGALDTASGWKILNLFGELNEEGRTIVMITHDPKVAARAKRRIFLRDGEIQEIEGDRGRVGR